MLTSLDLANHFGFRIISGDREALERKVTKAELDRPGLELLGIFQFHQEHRILLLGNKEIALINESDQHFIKQNCLKLFSKECPAVIITQNNKTPNCLLEAAREANIPLFSSSDDTANLSSDIYEYLSEALAPQTAMHACLMDIYGVGVIICGGSGIGKSEIALDLIKRGHVLIADDRVNISAVRNKLIGTCPEAIRGMMEVRGIGIIDVAKMFGINSLSDRANISLVIQLVDFTADKAATIERIGMKTERYEILGELVTQVTLPVSAARSMPEIIETAVTNFKLKESGYDTGFEFQKRLDAMHNKSEVPDFILGAIQGKKYD